MNNNIIHSDGDFEVEQAIEDVEFNPITPPKFFLESKLISGEFDDVNQLLDYFQKEISNSFYVYSLETSLPEEEREKTLVKYNVIIKLERKA